MNGSYRVLPKEFGHWQRTPSRCSTVFGVFLLPPLSSTFFCRTFLQAPVRKRRSLPPTPSEKRTSSPATARRSKGPTNLVDDIGRQSVSKGPKPVGTFARPSALRPFGPTSDSGNAAIETLETGDKVIKLFL